MVATNGSSSGRHVAVSDVAPGMCVSKEKRRDDLLCTVMMLGIVTVGCRCVVGVVGWASWMMVVVEKECCGLLMAPKSSIGVCWCLLWAWPTHSTIKRGQCVDLKQSYGSAVRTHLRPCTWRIMEWIVRFLMLTLFLTTQLVVFPWNFMWISSMESIWTP